MNPEKIKQRFFDNKGADIELIIRDDNNTINLKLHSFVLINSSDFFETLILFLNTNKKTFTIEVPDAYVVKDIIASFYGVKINSINYPKWRHILETLKCKNYLCLPIDVSELYNLEVPAEGFDLFFQVAELFGDITSNRKLMRNIKKNLPPNYDLTTFSEDFLGELFRKSQLIVSGSADNSIKIWDAESGECLKTLKGHSNDVRSVAFSCDNEMIVSGSNDRSIKIWDAEMGECLKTLEGHSDWVRSVVFSSDNKLIVSSSNDYSIKLWNTKTGECLKTRNGHSNGILSVSFSSDNKLYPFQIKNESHR